MSAPENIQNQSRYRVKTSREELEMLWNFGGESAPTEIFGLSVDGVEFLVHKKFAKGVKVGDSCMHVFFDLLSGARIEVLGIVQELGEEQGTYIVNVLFEDQESLSDQLAGTPTWRHFNRRHHFRVAPRVNRFQPAKVELEWRGNAETFMLNDVSANGLAIRVPKHNKIEIPSERPIRATLALPNRAESLEFVLKKMHERVTSTHRRIGFQIDAARTAYMESVEDSLVSAVMEWQRSTLQAKAQIRIEDRATKSKRRPA